MKLYQAGPSPFARKVRVVAQELGVSEQIELVDILVAPGKANAEFAAEVNPLRKVPALTLDDGLSLVDSTLICLYLDDLADGASLIGEGKERWRTLNAQAVANGMADAAVALRYENFLRPEARRWDTWSTDLWDKIESGLTWFESRASDNGTPVIDLGTLALGCLLGYLDFRSPEHGWRDRFPRLAADFETMSARPSFSSTVPE